MPAASAHSPARHLGVIGLGLIGGSLALAAKQAGWTVSAYNRRQQTAQAAAASGAIDHAAAAIDELGKCDIIFIAVPMNAYDDVLQQLAPAISAHTIITDGGSTKRDTIAAAKRQLGDNAKRFVPSHPIAGKEQSGWQAASADLFINHLVLVCDDQCDKDAAATVLALWQQVGARTQTIAADKHDESLAAISHLPHLLAFALVSAIDRMDNSTQLLQFAAGGFRDFTRIAGSHPDMWRDICLANSDNLLETINWYQRELAAFADYLKNSDGDSLSQRFAAARQLRQQWIDTLEQ